MYCLKGSITKVFYQKYAERCQHAAIFQLGEHGKSLIEIFVVYCRISNHEAENRGRTLHIARLSKVEATKVLKVGSTIRQRKGGQQSQAYLDWYDEALKSGLSLNAKSHLAYGMESEVEATPTIQPPNAATVRKTYPPDISVCTTKKRKQNSRSSKVVSLTTHSSIG